jgi:TDG/mug DNA glycosylase family protein
MSELVLPNLLPSDIKILFIGINPGLRSAAIGHHFAGHSNRFWRLLADSGLTSGYLTAEQDSCLLDYHYGITNVVHRPTAGAAELTPSEFKAGAELLLLLMQQHLPRIAAYLGKDSYRYIAGRRDFGWGLQQPAISESIIDFVLPNPSGLNRMPFQEQLFWYKKLKERLDNLTFINPG